jgi:hypothetical protein
MTIGGRYVVGPAAAADIRDVEISVNMPAKTSVQCRVVVCLIQIFVLTVFHQRSL